MKSSCCTKFKTNIVVMAKQSNSESHLLLDSDVQGELSSTISIVRNSNPIIKVILKILVLIFLLFLMIKLFSIHNGVKSGEVRYKYENEKQKLLTEFILNTTQVFDAHSIPYWLDAGTALGAFRNGGVFRHDYDADITLAYLPNDKESEAAFYKRAFSVLKEELGSLFRLEICRGKSDDCYTNWEWGSELPPHNDKVNDIQFEICEIHRQACHNPDLDIMSSILHDGFLFRTSLESTLTYSQTLHDNQKDGCHECPVPFDFIFPLKRLEFGPDKVHVNVPNQIERYLKFRYRYIGEDAIFDKKKGYYKPPKKQEIDFLQHKSI